MGFFGEELDLASAPDITGFSDPDAGIYSFEVTGAQLKKGEKNGAAWKFFEISYLLNNKNVEDKKWSESLGMPAGADFDPHNPSKRDEQQLGYLKARLLALGVDPAGLNDFEPDDIQGVTGTFQIVKTKSKKEGDDREFTNIRSMKLNEEKAAKPVQAVARKAPAKRTAAPVQKPAPVAEAADDAPEYTTEDVPDEAVAEEAAPAPARTAPKRPATVSGNPFA